MSTVPRDGARNYRGAADDDVDEMSGPTSSEPSGMAPGTAAMTAFLAELRAFGAGSVPPPGPALAALLDGTVAVAARRPWRRAVIASAAAAVVLGGTAIAAAHDSLPEPAQGVVTHLVNFLTPFQLDPGTARPRPVPPVPTVPAATPRPSPASTAASPTPERSDDRSAAPQLPPPSQSRESEPRQSEPRESEPRPSEPRESQVRESERPESASPTRASRSGERDGTGD